MPACRRYQPEPAACLAHDMKALTVPHQVAPDKAQKIARDGLGRSGWPFLPVHSRKLSVERPLLSRLRQ